ncbi:hypothetical protein [Chitinophaga flava]|uniref:Uncharacterized protein n=1 Tax=Chitinophaga flava TaxID=2259036 RepID=A0A365XR80_9BACT|nr:hypothetical protein [Chitinophaga flava]RBL88867.1 hypothetical protein DF182_20145 [Chitinophaga flava]
MKLKIVSWKKLQETLPTSGKHIVAQQTDDSLVVYQAFQPAIANYAVAGRLEDLLVPEESLYFCKTVH